MPSSFGSLSRCSPCNAWPGRSPGSRRARPRAPRWRARRRWPGRAGAPRRGGVGARGAAATATSLGGPAPSPVLLVLHDLSESEALHRMRQDFVANVSHELRTPLTSLRGYAETLLEGGLDDA